jgi:hypothetical protein
MIVAGEQLYDSLSPNSYTGVCTSGSSKAAAAYDAANDQRKSNTESVCNLKSDNTAWCACVALNVANTYCVDSDGYKKATATACATRCPAAGACAD